MQQTIAGDVERRRGTGQLDRLAALGMVSVFDIEEVGADVLQNELEVSPEVATALVEVAAAKAKVVAEQQAKEKEEAELKRKEEEEAARQLLAEGGDVSGVSPDAAAAAILSAADSSPANPIESPVNESDDARAAAILGDDPSETTND